MKKLPAKLMTSSKILSDATIAALTTAANGSKEAVALACLDGAAANLSRRDLAIEIRKVCALTVSNTVLNAGLTCAKSGADKTAVETAIYAAMDVERRKVAAKRAAARNDGEDGEKDKDGETGKDGEVSKANPLVGDWAKMTDTELSAYIARLTEALDGARREVATRAAKDATAHPMSKASEVATRAAKDATAHPMSKAS